MRPGLCAIAEEERTVALLYDQFGIRRFQLEVTFWPEMDGFLPGQLSQLYAALNGQDLFSLCMLQSTEGARFEGEHWVYDISDTSLLLRCTGYSSTDELRRVIRFLLSGTRDFFPGRRLIFFVTEVRAFGIVPDDKDRDIGGVVEKRLLARVPTSDREALPGLAGAGLLLVGDENEQNFHWHARIEPPHGSYHVLALEAELMFWLPDQPPTAGGDLDRIDEQVMTTYAFITDSIRTFASKVFH